MKTIQHIDAELERLRGLYLTHEADKSLRAEILLLNDVKKAAQVYSTQRDPAADLKALRDKMAKRNTLWYNPQFRFMVKDNVKAEREQIDKQYNTAAMRHQIQILEYLLS